jgi:hypothetical protein
MKYFLMLFVVLSSISLYSQPYKASAAYQWALGEAIEDVGPNAKLKAIATANGLSAGVFTIDFDVDNGTSNVWLYSFEGDNGSETNVIGVRLVQFTNVTQLVGDVSAFMSFLPSAVLSTDQWIDSDIMMQNVLSSQQYIDLSAKYSDADLRFIALGNNEMNSQIPMDEPFWTVTYEDDQQTTNFICNTHAIDGYVECFDALSSVGAEKIGIEMMNTTSGLLIYSSDNSETSYIVVDVNGRIKTSGSARGDHLITNEELGAGRLFIMVENENGRYATALENIKRN